MFPYKYLGIIYTYKPHNTKTELSQACVESTCKETPIRKVLQATEISVKN